MRQNYSDRKADQWWHETQQNMREIWLMMEIVSIVIRWWRRRGKIQDEIVGWHYQLDGHEFEQALGV